MSDNDIKNYSPVLDERAEFDGGKNQMDEMEKANDREWSERQKRNAENNKKIAEMLKDAPLISMVSEEKAKEMMETSYHKAHYTDSINIARITEKLLSNIDKDNITEETILAAFDLVVGKVSELTETQNREHITYCCVSTLHDAWSYGELIRRWWNKQYLHGEEAELFEGVFDYRQNNRNLSYRIKPIFPGQSKLKDNNDNLR